MFFIKYHSPTKATISWQTDTRSYTTLSEATISTKTPEGLQRRLSAEKAAWFARTVEDFLRGISKALLLRGKDTFINWPEERKKPVLTVKAEKQTEVWRHKWQLRVMLKRMNYKWIQNNNNLASILKQMKHYGTIFSEMLPSEPNRYTGNLERVAEELETWLAREWEVQELNNNAA